MQSRSALADVVVCKGVYRSYETLSGPVEVLRGVDLTIPRRSITALRGPSGSGKSTLLRLIACIERAGGGTVAIDGRDTTRMSRRRRRHLRRRNIGVISQDPAANLLDYLTVKAHLQLGARMRGLRATDHEMGQLLDRLGIGDRADHKPRELSGGQQQRVAVAFAAMGRPALIVADEPTGHLDHVSGEAVMQALASVAKSGVAVVIATHDRIVAERADRIIDLADGVVTGGRL
jgi:putative ABC transport system ATP-binding protein